MEQEFEVKAQSFYEYLKSLDPSQWSSTSKSVDAYKKHYEDLYSKYDKLRANTNTNYSKKDLADIERELNHLQTSMEGIISMSEQDLYSNNSIPYFIADFTRFQVLRKKLNTVKSSVKSQNIIRGMFGNFDTREKKYNKKGIVEIKNKSSKQLTEEKNERLAVLHELYQQNAIDEKEYADTVFRLNDCYQIEIEKQLEYEAKHLDAIKNDKKYKKVIKQILTKVKNTFHIGEPVSSVEDKDLLQAKKSVINQKAFWTLDDARGFYKRIIDSSESQDVIDKAQSREMQLLLSEKILCQDIPVIEVSPDLSNLFDNYYKEKAEKGISFPMERLYISSIYNRHKKLKTKNEINNDFVEFLIICKKIINVLNK